LNTSRRGLSPKAPKGEEKYMNSNRKVGFAAVLLLAALVTTAEAEIA
jgi:hypothetical protein